MFRYIMTKTQYKKLFDNFMKNFTICSSSKQSVQQTIVGNKLLRLDENSLQPRILKYLKPSNGTLETTSEQWSNLSKLNNNQLAAAIFAFKSPDFSKKNSSEYLQHLDEECCSRIKDLTITEIFNFLYNFMQVIPHIITRLTFYSQCMYKLSFLNDSSSKNDLIRICFYAAVQKKSKQARFILKNCFSVLNQKYINELNVDDLTIICNASYKSSTKVGHRKLLDKVISTLYNNLNIINDNAIFVTYIKTIRQNQAQNEELLITLSNVIFFNRTLEKYNFTVCSHLLALYADHSCYDNNLFPLMVNKCLQDLRDCNEIKSRDIYLNDQIRLKDIARLLWALSFVNYEYLSEQNIEECFIPLLRQYLQLYSNKQRTKDTELFIDCLLSLWTIGIFPPKEIFMAVVNKNSISQIQAHDRKRSLTRVNLLLSCVQMEASNYYKQTTKPSQVIPWNRSKQLRNRPLLKQLHSSCSRLIATHQNLITHVDLTSAVPHLNIIGLTLSKGGQEREPCLFLELIDDLTAIKDLSDSNIKKNGLIQLKIRLLNSINKPVLVIYKSTIEDMSPAELDSYLKIQIENFLTTS